jgi:hypothetical protein
MAVSIVFEDEARSASEGEAGAGDADPVLRQETKHDELRENTSRAYRRDK